MICRTMNHDAPTRSFTLSARDGFALSAAVHEPDGDARASVVLLGATAVPRSFYDRFAASLARDGFRVLSFDYRGVGASRPDSLKNFQATMSDWADLDASAALECAKNLAPSLKLFIVGHSFGGHVIGLSDSMTGVDGVVLVGSQLPFWKHFPGFSKLSVAAFWYGVVPVSNALFGYVPGSLGVEHDLPAGVASDWAHWGSHPDYLVGFVPEAVGRFARFTAPVLFYSFTDDWYAPEESSLAFIRRLTHAPVLHRRMHPKDLGARSVGHFGFFRTKPGKPLWHEVSAFFDDVLAGRAPQMPAARFVAPEPDPQWVGAESEVMADLMFGR